MIRLILGIIAICFTLSTVAQTQCEQLEKKLEERRALHHKVLADIRYDAYLIKYVDGYKPQRSIYSLLDRYSDAEVHGFEECGREVDINLVYDDYARHRVLQLLKNEFEEGELEALVRLRASDAAKMHLGGEIDIDSMIETRRPKERELLLSTYSFDLGFLIELSGVIEYDGIVEQLETMVSDSAFSEYKQELLTALVCHKVEPYYSEFLSSSRFFDGCRVGDMSGKIFALLRCAPSQESILLLSDYLGCNEHTVITTADGTDPIDWHIRDDALYLLRRYVMNEDFMFMCGGFKEREHITNEESRKIISWLNTNYGKYKIRRFW
ncbi:MAG: hypothetical protein II951_05030 [Bacteroidales bacterium]|nr:hypothetical protein [Bacteroidales bacterium]